MLLTKNENENLAKLNIPDVGRVLKHASTGFMPITKKNQMLKEIKDPGASCF
jgi:hypothetical protein